MQSPYAPLFDSALEMSPDDKRRVGLTTALLIVRRPLWLHRRVELVSWEDQDVIRRSTSLDFTLPHWAPQYLGVDGSQQARIAVPIRMGWLDSECYHYWICLAGSGFLRLPGCAASHGKQYE